MSHKTISILGASLDTGNLGVSALAWSAVNALHKKFPDAEIHLIGGREKSQTSIRLTNGSIEMTSWPVRYSPKLFMANHILWMLLGLKIIKLLPFLKTISVRKNSTLRIILDSDIIADITGGDSFSDIYGMKRFIFGYLIKRLCQLTGKPFVMLPQTYGPFNSSKAKYLAKKLLQKAAHIYSRDNEGLLTIKNLIGDTEKASLCPDVAFTLEPEIPDKSKIKNEVLTEIVSGRHQCQIIGLNISGLLFNNGYTGKNEFKLACDYQLLVHRIIDYFTSLPNTTVLLVPHVVPESFEVENDLTACRKLHESLKDGIKKQVIIAEPAEGLDFFDQCEIKSIIGKCNFFLGSRMHATIGAISQCIPTAGLAYSKKFAGVYETVDTADCVVDLRDLSIEDVLSKAKAIYSKKEVIKQRLEKSIPIAKQKVLSIFDNF